jgi:hypothetical protein
MLNISNATVPRAEKPNVKITNIFDIIVSWKPNVSANRALSDVCCLRLVLLKAVSSPSLHIPRGRPPTVKLFSRHVVNLASDIRTPGDSRRSVGNLQLQAYNRNKKLHSSTGEELQIHPKRISILDDLRRKIYDYGNTIKGKISFYVGFVKFC